MYLFFKDMLDPATGKNFFSSGHRKRCIDELKYVAAGYLSDMPGVPLYTRWRQLRTGYWLSKCRRTSSGLEGYHQHLDAAVASCGKRAGLRYTSAATNAFDNRWVVRQLRSYGLLPSWLRHTNVALVERRCTTSWRRSRGGGRPRSCQAGGGRSG